ncbi:MAG: cupin domain-containing protein [Alphaproteobacteria bacterium]|nr:cupin domain-containing protein [Alphaproteobacteria bacterium]
MASVYDLSPDLLAQIEEAEKGIKTYRYRKPDGIGTEKARVELGRGGNVRGVVQVVKDGGENNLHYHTDADSFWMVLKGRVKFYGVDDELLGEFGPHEGIITPAFTRYWFESSGDEELELLQVGAFSGPDVKSSGRTDCEPQRYQIESGEKYVDEGGTITRDAKR